MIMIRLLMLFTFFLLHELNSQGIDFFEGSFEEALIIAETEDKLVFVDAYTTWCGPCKRMKRDIFPDKQAGDFYNANFINMAIDMESQAGKAFHMKYPVRGYPSFLYINSKGDVVKRGIGGKSLEAFIEMGTLAIQSDDRSEEYAKIYKEGNRDFNFALKYIKSLNRADKPTAPIAYKYLKTGPKLTVAQKAEFIFEAAQSCDSRLFELMTEKRIKKEIIKKFGKDSFNKKVDQLCWVSINKGIELNVMDLHKEVRKKYKGQLKDEYPKFDVEVDLAVAKHEQNASFYLKSAKKYAHFLDDPDSMNEFALEMTSAFKDNDDMVDFSEKLSEKAIKMDDSIKNNLAFAKLLVQNKNFAKALDYINLSIDKASKEKSFELMREVRQLKKFIEGKLK